MSNASLIYESLRNYADIKGLLGRQEDIFLDFKTRSAKWNKPGFLSDDERRLYSKAASGFAHQEGGVLICADDTEDEQTSSASQIGCRRSIPKCCLPQWLGWFNLRKGFLNFGTHTIQPRRNVRHAWLRI
jgi:hypothetical protein